MFIFLLLSAEQTPKSWPKVAVHVTADCSSMDRIMEFFINTSIHLQN